MNEQERILKRLKELRDTMPDSTTVEGLLDKAREREAQMGEEGAKKQIGVHMPVDLWWRFKEAAAKERVSAGKLLERLVREYLERTGEESAPVTDEQRGGK